MITSPPDILLDDLTQESDEELSQPVVSLHRPTINQHLQNIRPDSPYTPLDYVTYEKPDEITPTKIDKSKTAENLAKQTTPATTRQQTKIKHTPPTTLKKIKQEIYYDPRKGVVKLGSINTLKCFPDLNTFMVVAVEFLKQDCRDGQQSLKSLAAHLPYEWGRHAQADPCVPDRKKTTEILESYVKKYLSNPKVRWSKEFQKQAKTLQKYLT